MNEPLSPEDLRNRYAQRLRDEREALNAEDASTDAARKPVVLDQQSVGRLSRMDALQGQAMAQALHVRREGRVRAIAAALQRLETDDFGWCDDCGEFIGVKRLDLDPTIPRCVSCAR